MRVSLYEIAFERGKTAKPLEIIGDTELTGTRVWFKPDIEIFEETVFSFDTLKQRLRELVFLIKDLRLP